MHCELRTFKSLICTSYFVLCNVFYNKGINVYNKTITACVWIQYVHHYLLSQNCKHKIIHINKLLGYLLRILYVNTTRAFPKIKVE